MTYHASPWIQEATRRARPVDRSSFAAGDGATGGKQLSRKPSMKPTSADLRVSSSASSAIVEDETRTLSLLSLTLLGLLLGIVTGIGAVLFRELIGLLHNLFFAGQFAFAYDANEFTAPSRWGAFVILAPVVGGVIVTFLVSNFAPEAKGHGVPEVMDAIYYKEGKIRPIVALVKSLASAFATVECPTSHASDPCLTEL